MKKKQRKNTVEIKTELEMEVKPNRNGRFRKNEETNFVHSSKNHSLKIRRKLNLKMETIKTAHLVQLLSCNKRF